MKIAAKCVLPAAENLSALPVYVNLENADFRNLEKDNNERVFFSKEEYTPLFEEKNRAILDQFSSHSRENFTLKPEVSLSFGSFFNAFPVSHWKAHTLAKRAVLRIEVETESESENMHAFVTVKISDENAKVIKEIKGGLKNGENEFEVDFSDVSDLGGLAWFEISSGQSELKVANAAWMVDDSVQKKEDYKASIAITTFNNKAECVKQIERVASNALLRESLEKLIIVDQGNDKVLSDPTIETVKEKMGDQLKIVEQGNLGGSGGFARGQLEAVCGGISGKENRADAVILMDDDVVVETEAIRRAIFFASCCEKPQLVGAHMFALERPTEILNSGETVLENEWTWRALDFNSFRYVHMYLALYNYTGERFFAKRRIPSHNGWWMCLIPREVVEKVGLSFPGFIKWDDVEFGVRAKKAGFETVTLPGVHVWHLSFIDKNDLYDWQAYYHVRNGLVTNLIHSTFSNGGRFLSAIERVDKSYLTAMHYGAVSLHCDAIKDVLSGPKHLHETLAVRNVEARNKIKLFDDGKVFKSSENELLQRKYDEMKNALPSHAKSVFVRRFQGLAAIILNKLNLTLKDEVLLSVTQAGWWEMFDCKKCFVFATDGSFANIYHRSHDEYKRIGGEIGKLYSQLKKNWNTLKKEYQQEFSELVSPEKWRETFEKEL